MTSRTAMRAGLTVLLAGLAAALLAAPTAETAPAAKVKSPWQLFPGAKMDVSLPLLALGSAANRVWIVTPMNDVPILRSARVSGGRLATFAQTRVPTSAGLTIPIVDGQLVLQKVDTTKSNEYTLTATTLPLLAGGGLGAPRAVPDDLLARAKEAVPKVWSAGIVNGVGAGNRVVWALEAAPECHSMGGCRGFFLACCSEAGAAVDLTRFVDPRENLLRYTLHVGRDSDGRIWLAWLDNRDYRHAARGFPRILELDGSTLRPLSQAAAIPGLVADRIDLACASSCRVVAQTSLGDIVSWAPGERSPTRVASHWDRGKYGDSPMWLLAATYRSGHLLVAYWGDKGKTIYADNSVRNDIRVARGNTRGGGARVVSAIPVANSWPPQSLGESIAGPIIYGTFTPGGLVAIETFTYTPRDSSPVAAAVVPLGP